MNRRHLNQDVGTLLGQVTVRIRGNNAAYLTLPPKSNYSSLKSEQHPSSFSTAWLVLKESVRKTTHYSSGYLGARHWDSEELTPETPLVLPQTVLQGRVPWGLCHGVRDGSYAGKCPVHPSKGRPSAGGWGMPDCFLSPLSLGSQEPRTELLGALPIPWPSWWSSGVVVRRLKAAVSRVLWVLQLHYDSQRTKRSKRFAGSLAAWARCQETDWQAAPFPFCPVWISPTVLPSSCHPDRQADRRGPMKASTLHSGSFVELIPEPS